MTEHENGYKNLLGAFKNGDVRLGSYLQEKTGLTYEQMREFDDVRPDSELIEMNDIYHVWKERLVNSKFEELGTKWSAYSNKGGYIGNKENVKRLVEHYGIFPEKSAVDHKVCSIGFAEKEQKWYGWSHRAIFGFKIGDVLTEGASATCSGITEAYQKLNPQECRRLPVGFKAETLYQCKLMAIAFADSVN